MTDACILAADFYVNNRLGPSPVAYMSYMADGGIRTLSGGQYSLQVDGFITVQAQAAPAVIIDATHAVREVTALVRSAPIGGDIALQMYQDSDPWGDGLVIPNGSTSRTVPGRGMTPLRAGAKLTLQVVATACGVDTFPGPDLTISIRM